MYAIESNVAILERVFGHSTASKYPLNDMRVGDSFLVPCEPATQQDRRRISSAVTGYQKRRKDLGLKFSIRSVEGGVRVWRVA